MEPPPRPSLRERKKAQTREALHAAAMKLFKRKGFENTTVDEIAEAADVSRRTFFRYYATKEAVVMPNREARLARFEAHLSAGPPGEPPFRAVRRACLAIAEEYMEQRGEVLAAHRVISGTPTLIAFEAEDDLRWEAAIARALARKGRRGSRNERRAQVLAGATMGVIRATLRLWFDGGGKGDLVALGDEALRLLEDGVREGVEA